VPAPVRKDDTTLVGDGWTFTLKPGWVIREGARKGDYEVVRIGAVQAPASQPSPIRFVSPGSAPSIIVHGDADTSVPIEQGETMYVALTKAGVPASFIRIKGAEHGFAGAAPADLERAYAAQLEWFERHLGTAAK
jgi:acetyl esterase/lipase